MGTLPLAMSEVGILRLSHVRTYYTVPVGNVDPTTMVSNEFSNPVLISLERGTPSNNCREYMAMTKRTE